MGAVTLAARLAAVPALTRPDLLAPPVLAALRASADADQVAVAEIDPALADTASFCAHYGVGAEESANCVVVAGRRGQTTTMAACVVLASTRADVNGLVRRHLGARKASFAPMEEAVALTGMEYGGITPIGLPQGWPILVDPAVTTRDVVIGSGVRRSKLVVPGALLGRLPGAVVLDGLGQPTDRPESSSADHAEDGDGVAFGARIHTNRASRVAPD
ncbi:MAG: YbaK/EbsC family protein [Acidothermus sp.]|nr:YbaK/EbsC family protein [Acidothermus sp.]